MKIDIPTNISQALDRLIDQNHQVYLVGGAVRDFLLNKPLKDWDFTTDATPDEMLAIFPDAFYKNNFGTVSIPIESVVLEITTMRQESDYQDNRHPAQLNWTKDISQDLQRRDFTINAMAMKYQQQQFNQIIDPFNGQQDLNDKIIKAVGNPVTRFNEDALRLMRAVRFAAQLGFSIEQNTLQAISKQADLLNNISHERIRDEFIKILETDNYYDGVVMLRHCRLLRIFLPEVENCFGVVQEGPKHDRVYDIGEHLMLSLKYCPSADPIIRLVCLLHDIGKPATYRQDQTGNVTFYHHEVVGAQIAEQICERLRLSRSQTDLIVTLIRWHMFSVDENQTDAAIRRIIRHIKQPNVPAMLALREADRLGGGTQNPTSWRLEKFKKRIIELTTDRFTIQDLKVNGQDVMQTLSIKPSRQVGEILEQLFNEVEQDMSKNDREYLLNRIAEFRN